MNPTAQRLPVFAEERMEPSVPADGNHLSVGAGQIAAALFAASPARARAFAVTMHERACEDGSDDQAGFWLLVVECLPQRPAMVPLDECATAWERPCRRQAHAAA